MRRCVAACAAAGWLFACGPPESIAPRDAAPPDASPPNEILLYRALPPQADETRALELASSVFGVAGDPLIDADAITIAEGSRAVRLYRESGAIEYIDRAKLANVEYVTASSEEEARDFADAWLGDAGLLPVEARFIAARAETAWKAPVVNHWLVVYGFELESAPAGRPSAPIPVKGAEIRARVGNGEVIGLTWIWRPVEIAGTTPVYDADRAFQLAAERDFPTELAADPVLYYRAYPEHLRQALLPPFYGIAASTGPPEDKLVTISVAAADLVPRVTITATPTTVTEGEPIRLHAEVTGGTPPYDITWLIPLADTTEAPPLQGADLDIVLPPGVHRVGTEVRDREGTTVREDDPVDPYVEHDEPDVVDEDVPVPEPCNDSTPTRLSVETAHRGWTWRGEITPNDGLALYNVMFKGHKFAPSITLPHYVVETERMPRQTCELAHPSQAPSANCRSVLEFSGVLPGFSTFSACYWITNLPAGDPCSGSLEICQIFRFDGTTQGCPPFDALTDCAPYKPWVEYKYFPPPPATCPAGNDLVYLEVKQRFDFDVPGRDVAAFYTDFDDFDLFRDAPSFITPPSNETVEIMAAMGMRGTKDNYHQKGAGDPVTVPGCTSAFLGLFPNPGDWDCSHAHWRWAAWIGPRWGGGKVLVPASQTIAAAVLLFRAGEFDPPDFDFTNYLNGEALAPAAMGSDLVLWVGSASVSPHGDVFGHNDWFFR